jgi:DNA-binding IclR family transcriptional regulator
MERLRAQFDETVNLAVLQDREIVYLDILESTKAFRMAEAPGSRVPVHSTALGKAIAAFLPQEKLDEILSHCPWTRFTRQTITKPHDFVRVLAKVRRHGYGRDDEESERGASCIASAISNSSTAHAVAGISVSGPTSRIRTKRKAINIELKRATSAITKSARW